MAAMVATDTARGLLMPMPTMAATAMAATALATVATDTARGLLMPMPTMVLATAMAAMVATDTARGLLMLMPTTAAATAMAVTAMAVTATASKPQTSKSAIASLHQNCHLKISSITRRPGKLMAVCLSTINQTTNEE